MAKFDTSQNQNPEPIAKNTCHGWSGRRGDTLCQIWFKSI